jgi:lysophospholipase L1-like esterase
LNGKIKKLKNSNGEFAYPITVSDAVFVEETKDLKTKLLEMDESIANFGSGTVETSASVTYPRLIVHGDVRFTVNNLSVSWTSGTLYSISGGKYTITAGSATYSFSIWNPNSTTMSLFCYNPTTSTFEPMVATSVPTYTGDSLPIFGARSGFIFPLFYPVDYIGVNTPTDSKIMGRLDSTIYELTVIGDSLSASNKWVNYLDMTVGKVNNLAVSGMRMAGGSGIYATKRTLVNAVSDCCVILAGTNDAADSASFGSAQIPIGAINDGNQNTFLGAYSLLIQSLLTTNNKMRILTAVPPKCWYNDGSGDIRTNEKIEPYRQAVRDLAKYFGLPCLHLDEEFGINEYNSTVYMADGLHPNDAGNRRMGKIFDKFIKRSF